MQTQLYFTTAPFYLLQTNLMEKMFHIELFQKNICYLFLIGQFFLDFFKVWKFAKVLFEILKYWTLENFFKCCGKKGDTFD